MCVEMADQVYADWPDRSVDKVTANGGRCIVGQDACCSIRLCHVELHFCSHNIT